MRLRTNAREEQGSNINTGIKDSELRGQHGCSLLVCSQNLLTSG